MSHRSAELTMIVVQLSHGLALISSCTDRREAILEKSTFKFKIQFLVLTKNLAKQFILIAQGILKLGDSKETVLQDRSSLTLESVLEMFLEDLPMRQRLVKSPFLHVGFSSSSELEESSLEKSKSLNAAYAWDMIFWNFIFFLCPKRCFFMLLPLL
jgi:hypothetical protein